MFIGYQYCDFNCDKAIKLINLILIIRNVIIINHYYDIYFIIGI